MRPPPARSPLPIARGVLAGTVCGLGAVLAHQLAGGTTPPWSVAAIWPASVLLCRWLVGRGRLRPTGALAAAGVAQLGWHLLLQAGPTAAPMSGPMTRPMAGTMSGPMEGMAHGHHEMAMADGAHGSHAMLLAHAGVAVATALLCLGADAVILRLLGLLAEWLTPRPLRATPPPVVPALLRRAGRLRRPRPRPVTSLAAPRGPPPVLV